MPNTNTTADVIARRIEYIHEIVRQLEMSAMWAEARQWESYAHALADEHEL